MSHDMPGHHMPGHDMPDHEMPMMCNMNMLFNWDTEKVCVVFKWWNIQSSFDLFVSMIAIIFICSVYEYLRIIVSRGYERRIATKISKRKISISDTSSTPDDDEINPLLDPIGSRHCRLSTRIQITRSIIYAMTSGLSLFIMLIFMTFNAYLMLAVIIGAGLGFFLFEGPPTGTFQSKAGMCH